MSEHPVLKPFWQMSSQFELCAESWSVLGVPMKYRHTFLETILPNNDEQTNLMNTFNQILRGRRGAFVFVSGSKDTGKTLMGSALVNSCGRWSCCYDRETERTFDYVPRFVSMQDLIDRITSYRSTKDWYNEYANVCRVLVIDRWNMMDGREAVTPAVKKRLEQMLKTRTDNGYITVPLSRLLWQDAYEQFTPYFREEMPELYIRPLAYAYHDSSNPFHDDEVDYE